MFPFGPVNVYQLLFLNILKISKMSLFEHFERKIVYVLPPGLFFNLKIV